MKSNYFQVTDAGRRAQREGTRSVQDLIVTKKTFQNSRLNATGAEFPHQAYPYLMALMAISFSKL